MTTEMHLIHNNPTEIYMGPIPISYAHIPQVIFDFTSWSQKPDIVTHNMIMCFPMQDVQDKRALPKREDVEIFLKAAHELASRRSSFWHCLAGLNRSGLMLAAYLHLYRDLKIEEAITLIRHCRSKDALFNPVFVETLLEWYSDK